jgi:hypothetical protein
MEASIARSLAIRLATPEFRDFPEFSGWPKIVSSASGRNGAHEIARKKTSQPDARSAGPADSPASVLADCSASICFVRF